MQTIRVRTTQNVSIDYPLGSIGDRILGYLIDRLFLIFYTALIAVTFISIEIDEEGWILWVIFIVFPWLFYSLLFEIFMNGQTPGKRLMNIQVVRLDGTPPTIGDYLLRWLFSFVDFLFSGAVAVVVIATNGKGQRLGDIVAGTSVVKLVEHKSITAQEVFTSAEDQHIPTFPEVVSLTDRDIELIQRALDVNRDQGNTQPVMIITEKIKSLLGIQSDLPPVKFLYTIIKDYQTLSAGSTL
jgi:uncharacterized RDD family membrane protein YckC